MLVKYHAGGDVDSPLAAYEFEEITRTFRLEKETTENVSYSDLFKTKGCRHRSLITLTLGVFAQWNGVGIVSYYLAPVLITIGITSVTNQTMISGFLQLWNLMLAVVPAHGMLGSSIAISGLSGSFANTDLAATGTAVIPFLFVFYGFYDIAFTPLLVSYTCEIWPYTYRAKGFGDDGYDHAACCVFQHLRQSDCAGGHRLEALPGFFYPETNGHSLEQMARVFDGDDADVIPDGEAAQAAEKKLSVGGNPWNGRVGEDLQGKDAVWYDVKHVDES